MFIRLFLLFTLLPLAELYILVKIGSYFGVMAAVFIVIGTGFLGALLAKQQGLGVWVRIQNEMRQGRFPGNELIDGLLLFIAGVVLVTPGLITDIIGFLLLVPVTRHYFKSWIKDKLSEMVKHGNVQFTGFIR